MGFIDRLKSGASNFVHKVENKVETAATNTVNTVKHDAQVIKDGFDSAKKTAGTVLHAVNPLGTSADSKYDGQYVGAGGKTYPPNTPLKDIPPVEPQGGARNNETIIYTNGIQTNKDAQFNSLQDIANTTGSKVIGVHNSTDGFAADIKQCVTDKLDKGKNPAVDTLADTIYSELKAGHDVHLMGHSQGGLITARALAHVQDRLRLEDGMSKADAEKAMGRITVETFGAASGHYVDGPKYTHNINRADPVPNMFGLGEAGDKWNPLVDAGKGAKINYFTETHGINLIANHSFDDVYLKHRQPPQ